MGTKRVRPDWVTFTFTSLDFPEVAGGSMVKNPPASGRNMGLNPDLGRVPEEGNGNLLLYSWLGNPMDRGAWWDTVYGVTKDQAWLKCWTTATKNGMEESDINMQSSGLLTLILLDWFIYPSTVNAKCSNPARVGATPVRTVTRRSRVSPVILVDAFPPRKRVDILCISSPATAVTNWEGSCLKQQKSLLPQI